MSDRAVDINNYGTSLEMFQPMNILTIVILYSPLLLALAMLFMTFIFQNFKGFIYLGFLLASCITREFIMLVSGKKANAGANNICNTVKYSIYGNSGFSIFVFSFTLFYLCMPMFLNKDVNYWIFGGILSYLLLDIGVRYTKRCITDVTDVLLNIVTGSAAGILIPGLMYAGGSSKYLFFNEISSNKEICSMPKKQQFKCNVYKNGELVSSLA
jgi:hypothetical protein